APRAGERDRHASPRRRLPRDDLAGRTPGRRRRRACPTCAATKEPGQPRRVGDVRGASGGGRPMTAVNVIRSAIAEGRPSFGVWGLLGSSLGAEIVGRSGVDWVLLDTQHGGIGPEALLSVAQALELGGASALVRVPWCDPASIMRALD